MRRLYLPFILLTFFTLDILAQAFEGTIINRDGKPVVGAYITHIESEHHTHTNELGRFTFSHIHPGDTLEVRHIGYDIKRTVVNQSDQPITIVISESLFELNEIVVEKTTKSLSLLRRIDLVTNPVNSSQEILTKVPGLFIAQHSGGGKAEQIFLRGFDIDHGTDINITVDGLPVNMVSHAHGQGYSDLHFLIPETIEAIDFDKGPYTINRGNFATAGYVDFRTKENLEESTIGFQFGRFNTFRSLGLFDLNFSNNTNGFVAAEYLSSNGQFENPQNLNRINLVGKVTSKFRNQGKLTALMSHFTSKWDASGLIPNRAVEQGTISRFGSVDPTQGGETSRSNFGLIYDRYINSSTSIRNRVYFTNYEFELYSNFTYFLENPIDGDQIRQRENRQIFGLESELNRTVLFNGREVHFKAGAGLRSDNVDDLELSSTRNRTETLTYKQLGDVDELNAYGYVNLELDLNKWLISLGTRLDYFDFQYTDQVDSLYNPLSDTRSIFSPKLNIIYQYNNNVQFFAKAGIGFHSNDTRVSVIAEREALPVAYGVDVGIIWKPTPRLVTNFTLWNLYLEQEFVYVGDEGIVEPSGRTRRTGIDIGARYQMLDWLFFDMDINYAHARSIDAEEGNQFVPLAPELTAMTSLSVIKGNFSSSLQARYLKDRPATEDNSLVAEGYFIMDLNLGYKWNKLKFGVSIENLLDSDWNEAQFATVSRLRSEPQPVEDINFIPGVPFFINGSVQYNF